MTGGVTAQVHDVVAFDLDRRDQRALSPATLSVADTHHFGLDVHVYIGEPDARETDDFRLICCSPSWFAQFASTEAGWRFFADPDGPPESSAVILGTGLWFMRRWDGAQLLIELTQICADASGGPTWGTVASRIGRLIPWEFDYRYDAETNAAGPR